MCLLDTPPSLWVSPLIGLSKCDLTLILVHCLLQHVLLGSSVKNLGKDTHSNQEPSDKHDNTRPVHARSYPDTTNRVNYDRTCLDLQLNGKAVLSDDIASNTLRITKGSFVRAHESTQSVHLTNS